MPDDSLDALLERWRAAVPPLRADLTGEVWRRVRCAAKLTWRQEIAAAWRRPAFGLACAVGVVVLGLVLVEVQRSRLHAARNAELARRYVQLIDPQGADGALRANDVGAHLAWLRDSLRLSPGQFARIKALHEQSSPRLLALAAQVAQLRDEFAAYEQTRRTTGEVDFLEFARFVAERRNVDRACAESTRRLILATAGVMDPPQREAYLQLIHPTLQPSRPAMN